LNELFQNQSISSLLIPSVWLFVTILWRFATNCESINANSGNLILVRLCWTIIIFYYFAIHQPIKMFPHKILVWYLYSNIRLTLEFCLFTDVSEELASSSLAKTTNEVLISTINTFVYKCHFKRWNAHLEHFNQVNKNRRINNNTK